MTSIEADYPEVIKLSQIGSSWEKRPLTLLTLDAYDYLKSGSNKLNKQPKSQKESMIQDIMDESFLQTTDFSGLADQLLSSVDSEAEHRHKSGHHHHHKKHGEPPEHPKLIKP